MVSEYFINSQELENKVRTLLPSQGGAGAGFDLSASTQIIPIIDLTESAQGSNVREDLQTAMSFSSITSFDVIGTTSTLINNTGYFRVFGNYTRVGADIGKFELNDGTTTKIVIEFTYPSSSTAEMMINYDFIVFLKAGDSFLATTNTTNGTLSGNTRQIADINGTLVNP